MCKDSSNKQISITLFWAICKCSPNLQVHITFVQILSKCSIYLHCYGWQFWCNIDLCSLADLSKFVQMWCLLHFCHPGMTAKYKYRDPFSFHILMSSVHYNSTRALPNVINLSCTMIFKSKYLVMKTFLNGGHPVNRASYSDQKLPGANQNTLFILAIVLPWLSATIINAAKQDWSKQD